MSEPQRTRRRTEIGQLSVLEGLQQIADNTKGNSALLGSVLTAIKAHQEMEIILVRDTGNADAIVAQINEYDETTDTWSVSYQNPDGTNYVPTGPLEYIDASQVLNLILTELLDQGLTLDSLDGKFSSLGQKVSASSTPVVLSTEQEAILVAMDAVLDNIYIDTQVLATPVTGLAVSMTRVTGAGAASVTAGKRRVSFFNAGNANASVAGATLEKGEVVTFSADGLRDTLASISYDALTSELLISTVG